MVPVRGGEHLQAMRIAIAIVLAALLSFAQAQAEVASRNVAPVVRFQSGMLAIEQFGTTGPPLIFIPALGCGSWQWNAQINALSHGYEIFAVTLPGFDGRPMASGGDVMQRAVRDLHTLIRSRHLHNVTLVGHSLGGTIVTLFGATYPYDAQRIVSVEGGYPVAPTQDARDARVARVIRPYEGIPRADVGRVFRDNTLQYTIANPADVDIVTRYAATGYPQGFIDWYRAALSLDLTHKLSSIVANYTMIVPFDSRLDAYNGFRSAQDKRAAYERFVSHAPHANVVMIENARHFVMFDRPRAFQAALDAILKRA
jgi:pimeloyl-ACP methyl ester carboxylesterase